MSKINYADFEKEMLNGQKYSDRNLRMIFRALSEMDRESRKWYIRFVLTGTYPDVEIEGYTVKDLVEKLNYTNTQAFLVLTGSRIILKKQNSILQVISHQ